MSSQQQILNLIIRSIPAKLWGIGIVLDKLHASGRYDDTLIIYISDNGIPFPGAKTDKKPEEELFDLANDPDEVNNLASETKYSSVLEDLKTKLIKIREQTDDPWLILEDYRINRKFIDKNFER